MGLLSSRRLVVDALRAKVLAQPPPAPRGGIKRSVRAVTREARAERARLSFRQRHRAPVGIRRSFIPDSRPVVPSSPGAIAGGPTEEEQEMGLFGFLGKLGSAAVGVVEGVTGFDIPFVGPGDRFLGGGGGFPGVVPGGMGGLDVAGLPIIGRDKPCPPFFVKNAIGQCVPGLGEAVGSDADALAGFGQPAVVNRATRLCGRGNVLDINGFCRDKRTIRNSDRMYPKPRRPLLTSGDLSCIATASRAAKRMKTQTKRLQKLGMLPR